MNCKPGDLAIVVRSKAGNEGRIGRCLRRASKREIARQALFSFQGEPCWKMDREFSACDNFGRGGYSVSILPDACLRPIRPGDISDEEVRDLYAPKLPEVV